MRTWNKKTTHGKRQGWSQHGGRISRSWSTGSDPGSNPPSDPLTAQTAHPKKEAAPPPQE